MYFGTSAGWRGLSLRGPVLVVRMIGATPKRLRPRHPETRTLPDTATRDYGRRNRFKHLL